MKKKAPSDFDIRLDETAPDSIYRSDMDEQRIDKISSRLTLISIIIPCIIGIVIFVVYLDLKKRYDNVSNTGSQNAQNLSENLDSTFSSLSVQFAKFEVGIGDKITALEKTTAALKKNLNKTGKTLNTLSRSKAGKKEFSGAITNLQQSFPPIQEGIQTLESEIRSFDKKFSTELTVLGTALGNATSEIIRLSDEMANLASIRTDIKVLDLTIKSEKKMLEDKLRRTTRNLEEKIGQLEKNIATLSQPAPAAEPASTTSPDQTPPSPEPSAQPSPALEAPKPGKIIEQDIE